MTSLVAILAAGIVARCAIRQYPELASVTWMLILLGTIVLFASMGRITLLEVP
jgi:hypothetical protein